MLAKQKLGLNDPCWCGSGKKYKHCHMRQDQAEAKRSAIEPAPVTRSAPEPPSVPPEIAAIARWEQFEAADLERKVAIFLETLASGEMEAEESHEMLQGIRDETDPRRDPHARALYAELLERLRREAFDLYRYHLPYYNENLINDAIAEGRWEAVPELLAGFAEAPGALHVLRRSASKELNPKGNAPFEQLFSSTDVYPIEACCVTCVWP